MKNLFAVALAFVLVFSVAFAEESPVTWHSVFGLSEGATEEEISSAIQSTFDVSPADIDPDNFYPDYKYFYGLPVRWVIKHVSDQFAVTRSLEIAFEDETLSAENIYMLYSIFCAEYGDPTVCSITKDIITVNGKEEVPLSITDLQAIQSAIDQCDIDGLVCWDNISIEFRSYFFSTDPQKVFKFNAAFSEDSLDRTVRMHYGIPSKYGK